MSLQCFGSGGRGTKGSCADTQTRFKNPRGSQLHFISYMTSGDSGAVACLTPVSLGPATHQMPGSDPHCASLWTIELLEQGRDKSEVESVLPSLTHDRGHTACLGTLAPQFFTHSWAQSPQLSLTLTNHFIPIPFLRLPPEPPANTPLPGSQSLTHSPAPIGHPPSSHSRCYCGLTSLSRACAAASWTLTNSCSGVSLSRSPAWVSVPRTEAVWRGGQASSPASTPCPLPSPPSARSLPSPDPSSLHVSPLH